jgi:DNA-binding transcriptional ArsR family regulator
MRACRSGSLALTTLVRIVKITANVIVIVHATMNAGSGKIEQPIVMPLNKTKRGTDHIMLILAHLRQDSRTPILEIARRIGIPKSTVYDHYRKLRERFWFTVVERGAQE